MKLEIKTTFISAVDVYDVGIQFVLSHAQWETRRDKAHGLLVWVEPLEVAFLLLSPIGELLKGLTSDDPSAEELRQAYAALTHPLTKACCDLGGGCAKDMGLPTALMRAEFHPHIAAVCPKALPTAGCPLPGAPMCPSLHRNESTCSRNDATWGLQISKKLKLRDQDHSLRRLLSAFVMIGFRPALYIDVGGVHRLRHPVVGIRPAEWQTSVGKHIGKHSDWEAYWEA